jgi:epoxyqueuosine reductase
MHGTLDYLRRDLPKRLNPDMVLAGARSVVAVAMNYYPGGRPDEAPLKGRISRYAWGGDYHELIRNRLKQLLDFVRRLRPAARGAICVDTGPVMEKAWAAETGLGWTGKNTILISRDLGSWLFLGILLLDIELEDDPAGRNLCGSCDHCIRACPTGAIVAPYSLDARLCVSCITVEHRGPIPRPLRALMGNRIFGCDDCQEACPWNRFAVKTSEKTFRPVEGNLMPELLPLVRLTPGEFRERFRGSPILRATRNGFVRNVAVALGNSGRGEAVPALEGAMRDPSALVRMHAAWALGRLASERSFRILRGAQFMESDPSVLEEIRLALEGAP